MVDGTFTFSSSLPVGVAALRGFTNERSEFLVTTLPVLDLFSSTEPASVVPHFVEGGGWHTEVILVNPGDFPIAGTVQFWSAPAPDASAGIVGSTSYFIAPRSSFRAIHAGTAEEMQTGWVRLSSTDRFPVAMTLFSFNANGITVTQSGAAAGNGSSAFRLYVEALGNSLQSAIALANSSDSPVAVSFELMTLSGVPTEYRGSLTIPSRGHIAVFVHQLPGFSGVAPEFQGVLRVSASAAEISLIGLRTRYNERGDFLVTTTPPVAESASGPPELSIPYLVDSGGYESSIILYSAYPGPAATAGLRYRSPSGQALDLRLKY
jgi:hypothetical protein